MAHDAHHPSDEALLRAVDGEQSPRRLAMLERHLASCAPCRARRQELHATAEEFFRACRLELADRAPLPDGLRERGARERHESLEALTVVAEPVLPAPTVRARHGGRGAQALVSAAVSCAGSAPGRMPHSRRGGRRGAGRAPVDR